MKDGKRVHWCLAEGIRSLCWTGAPHKAAVGTAMHWGCRWKAPDYFQEQLGLNRFCYRTVARAQPVAFHPPHICLLCSICSEWRSPRLYVLIICYLTNTWRGVMVSGTFWITALILRLFYHFICFPQGHFSAPNLIPDIYEMKEKVWKQDTFFFQFILI